MTVPLRRGFGALVLLVLALGLAACGGGGGEGGGDAEPPVPTVPAEADAGAGAAVWESAGCGTCHILAAAGATGEVGPNLDESELDFDFVLNRVEMGGGSMPAFKGQLDEQQLLDVSAYVIESTSG